jgi:hypothetical protein
MEKHVYSTFVLACTLSTRVGGDERTLPRQGISKTFNKKLPGTC